MSETTVSSSPIEKMFWDEWNACTSDNEGPAIKLIPQYQIGRYRVDYACPSIKVAIELDGHATHSSPDAIAYDRKRQRDIEGEGWYVIRFGGKEVTSNAGACVDEAWTKLVDRTEHISGDEVAMFCDRTYFRRHPGVREYRRSFIEGEISQNGQKAMLKSVLKDETWISGFSDGDMFVQPRSVLVTYIKEGLRSRAFEGVFVGFTEEGIKKLDGKAPPSMPTNIVKNPTTQKSKQFSRKPKSRRKRR